jgi:hypothetical protein
MMRFEALKKAVIESARLEGNDRSKQDIHLVEFALNSEDLYALDRWIAFGLVGSGPGDLDRIGLMAKRQQRSEHD